MPDAQTGRDSALHAATKPVANPVFNAEVALLFNRLSAVRPSRPGKTLHHDQ
jgi:hypothetical protein